MNTIQIVTLIIGCMNFMATILLIGFVWMLINAVGKDDDDRKAPYH